jgi:hypothetical protein
MAKCDQDQTERSRNTILVALPVGRLYMWPGQEGRDLQLKLRGLLLQRSLEKWTQLDAQDDQEDKANCTVD